ncbi:MAG: hypothetical protein LBT83_11385 [Tannerella sp.]|nr:hypothetical protein [Tannerella sp.]
MAQAAKITIERNLSGDSVFAHVEIPPSGWHSENTVPCRMTADALRTEVIQSVKNARNGLGITIEQARARHPRL